MKRKIVHTNHAPAAVGPYSQAVKTDGMVFTAGQIALDPATGKLVEGGIEEQTRQVMENLKAVLNESGASFDSVIKTTIFIIDMADFAALNAIYGEYFSDAPPARSTVAVAGLPLGGRVEIEMVARLTED